MSLFNIYRSMLHSVSDAADYHFVFEGLARLLNNIPNADATYLPYSTKKVPYFVLCRCWWCARGRACVEDGLGSEGVGVRLCIFVYALWGGVHTGRVGSCPLGVPGVWLEGLLSFFALPYP